MTANKVIETALAEIGVKEYPPNSNKVKYNTEFYGRAVSGSQYPWCCVFVWWVLSKCGVDVPKTASCMTLGDHFKKRGRFYKTNPQAGDIVFYKFSTNNRWTNHVGIVTQVKGNKIVAVEGNTSINSDDNGGSVMLRTRSSNIVGYGRPDYDENIDIFPTLKKGDRGDAVKSWQNYLITCGFDCGKCGADGILGKDTVAAIKAYQKKKGLPVTGVIDTDDWQSVGK